MDVATPDDAAVDAGAAAAAWDGDAAAAEEPVTAPVHPALIGTLPIHLCDDGTSLGTDWEGPTDTRRRIGYYCREPLHRNLSKGMRNAMPATKRAITPSCPAWAAPDTDHTAFRWRE